MTKRALIQGVGINDADYKYRIHENVNGKCKIVYQCKIHTMWKDLLRRCFNQNYKSKYPHYKEVTCCDDWLVFSKFKAWVDIQGSIFDKDGKVKQLDKDLLYKDNKVYSPENCILVSGKVNNFMLCGGQVSSSGVKGVVLNKQTNKLHVFCKDPFNRYSKYVGDVDNLLDGEVLYRKTKFGYLNDLYDSGYLETDTFYRICTTWFPEFNKRKENVS